MIETNTKVVRSVIRGLERKYDVIAQQGGTYSGKTFGTMVGLAFYLKDCKDKKKVRVIGQTREHIKDGVLDDFDTINNSEGLAEIISLQEKKYKVGQSTIKFLSIDKIGKAKGPKFDITFINECNYLDWTIVQQLILRTDETVILDWNPVGEFWFHDKLILDKSKRVLFKRTNYKDNPTLSNKKIREIEGLKDVDEALYRVYALGLTGKIKGLIFPNISYQSSFPNECKSVAYGLDFGFSNDPTALVKIGKLHGQLYGQELIYEKGLTNQDIADRFQELGISRKSEIFADAAEPKSIEEIRRKGFNIKAAKKGKDSVNFGISTLKEYKITLTNDSVNWRKEAKNYKWKEKDGDSLNAPIDKFNHCWDAARYYAIMKLSKKGSSMKPINSIRYRTQQHKR